MESFGLQFGENQLIALFAAFDKNLDGGISYDEFSSTMLAERSYRRPALPSRQRSQAYTASFMVNPSVPANSVNSMTESLGRDYRSSNLTVHTQVGVAKGPTSPAERIKAHREGGSPEESEDLRVRPPQFRQYHY